MSLAHLLAPPPPATADHPPTLPQFAELAARPRRAATPPLPRERDQRTAGSPLRVAPLAEGVCPRVTLLGYTIAVAIGIVASAIKLLARAMVPPA